MTRSARAARAARSIRPITLVAAECALLDDVEKQRAAAALQLQRAEREHTLVCAAILAGRGHRLADVRIVERTPHGRLVLQAIANDPHAPLSPASPPASSESSS
jgi:hypothetical protein